MAEFNWDDLRYFLTFVRRGNAYNAGRALAVDHTTVRRRIRALELSLSTKLFDTSGGNMVLTSQGELLFKSLEGIETSMVGVGNKITGAESTVAGRVRVGAPDGIGSVFFAPHLATFGIAYPELVVELLSTSRQMNVARRKSRSFCHIRLPVVTSSASWDQ